MGLTKDYLRYVAADTFGQVASPRANVLFLKWKGTVDRYCAVGACEDVLVWDTRTSQLVKRLRGEKHEVTILRQSPDSLNIYISVGYTNGSIKMFDVTTGDCKVTFNGHRFAVSAANYDAQGMRLCTGAKDTSVVVWDIVNEAGMYKLKGHKGPVTEVRFMRELNVLVTSSKDSFIKFWDLDTQHCFRTLVDHRAEVWDFVLLRSDTLLVTGSVDSELRAWQLRPREITEPSSKRPRTDDSDESYQEADDDALLDCMKLGSVMREGTDRVDGLCVDDSETVLACHGVKSPLELFKVSTLEESNKCWKKRQKKAAKRAREASEEEPNVERAVSDDITTFTKHKFSAKVKSVHLTLSGDSLKVLTSHGSNMLQLTTFKMTDAQAAPQMASLCSPGHRSDVRTLAFSADNTAVLSVSAEQAKVWNRASLQCIRTMDCDYALACLFAPGDRHIVVATKSGKLQLFDLAAGALLEEPQAHGGAVWGLDQAADRLSIVSGSADQTVKFWDWEYVSDPAYSTSAQRLSLVHARTLTLSEDVLAVRQSPDKKLVAVALLDNTVKVFFLDTLKFFLSLYGHKLPVLCMDISTDGKLIITGSADKNVKIWGLDFGDCHRSLFAHDDSVMSLGFIPKTHMFFSGGKDSKVKQWDADSFDHITTLEGHHGEVWALAVSSSGNFLVTSSHDKSLRLWERSEQLLVLSEEREAEREEEYHESIANEDDPVIVGEAGAEVQVAGRRTVETVRAAERVMEALQLHREESAKQEGPLHPMFQAFGADTPDRYLLEVLKRVRSSELEEALLVLPFSAVTSLLEVLHRCVRAGWEVELTCRCVLFLLRIHQGQLTANQMLLSVLSDLRSAAPAKVTELRDRLGFNLAALRGLQRRLEARDEVTLFADVTQNVKNKKKKQKRKAILTVT